MATNKAITLLITLLPIAEKTPKVNSKMPKMIAFCSLIFPLGITLSGRSILSNSKSKISLKTIPPPYNPMVEIHKKTTFVGLMSSIEKEKVAMATPAKISAIAVIILAGLVNCKYAFRFKVLRGLPHPTLPDWEGFFLLPSPIETWQGGEVTITN